MKTYKEFIKESHIGAATSWSGTFDGEEITITLDDINGFLDSENAPIIDIDPTTLEHLLIKVERVPERVQSASLDFPIILAEKNGKFVKILDGQHRVAKCLQNDIKTIKARVLDLDKSDEKYKSMFR